jgi:hypothetical protein
MPSVEQLRRDFERRQQRQKANQVALANRKRNRKRCGAHSRSTGKPCQRRALANGRCAIHGGKSTGPKTAEGKQKALRNLKQFKEPEQAD